MLEEEIVRHCAPTLAGIKTASAFSYGYSSAFSLRDEILAVNQKTASHGVLSLPLRMHRGRALIYVFRPLMLSRDLLLPEVRKMLSAYGYVPKNAEKCLIKLSKKLEKTENFPHEIGFFLGYPTKDVLGFILHRAKNYKALGLWKVYDDVEGAQRSFRLYERCTQSFYERFKKGEDIESLATLEKD